MGTRLSRAAVPQQTESRDIIPYRYPPPDDENYFSSHFHLGYRKFEAGEPEVFLFGELNDINFLPSKPIAFPYKQPSKSQPIKCLRSFVNLQRDSVKLVKAQGSDTQYHIEFIFDSDVPCQFTIYDFLPNSVELESLRSGPYLSGRVSRTFQYPAGSEQRFSETGYTVAPGDLQEDQLSYDPENDQEKFPIAILLETNTSDGQYQSQLTVCNLDKFNDSGYTIKVLKQKLLVDGVEYLLQEIYGIENKSKQQPEEGEGQEEGGAKEDDDSDDDDEEDLGAECVICITDPRDTILLPCRHLCLCNSCAANLRYQSSNCPICRAPFRALLNIQALEPLDSDVELDDDEVTGNPKYAIPGYKMVPLLSALNGYQLENSENASLADPSGRSGNHEQQEEESAAEEEHSPRGQTTSQFCAIPIEDLEEEENEITTGVIPIPRRSTHHSQQKAPQDRVKQYEIDEGSIPLPGTPTSEEDDIRFRMKRTASNSSSNQLTTSVTISIASNGEERQEVVSLELHPQHPDPGTSDPESPCASSVSSQQSVKSTDVLLPAQTRLENQGKGGGKKAGDSGRRVK